MKKEVSYYLFERVDTYYFNTKGEKVSYKRTTRVNKKNTLGELVEMLQKAAQKYLIHRFYVSNDNNFWKKFLESTPYYVLWLDYSQNIAFTEKKQVQSAHFSGLQRTLHDTVIISPRNSHNNFVYHLSDDTNHDDVLTFSVIDDIIESYPYVIRDDVLLLRSDNCENQYKCLYTFAKMRTLAMTLKISVGWFYGQAGHGKGIVDAMSSFGCKQPMKKAILNKDEWFMNAEEMCIYLTKYFKELNDDTKHHHLISAEATAEKRKVQKEEHKIIGSRSFHIICIDPEGNFTTLKYTRDIDIIEKIKQRLTLSEENKDVSVDDEVDEDDQAFRINFDTIFELLEPGVFIGVRSEENSLEPFYIVECVRKDIADDFKKDNRGHVVAMGDMYVEVVYLEKKSEVGRAARRKILYQRTKDDRLSYVNMGEIFITNVELSDNLTMDMNEYTSILQTAL